MNQHFFFVPVFFGPLCQISSVEKTTDHKSGKKEKSANWWFKNGNLLIADIDFLFRKT